MDCRVARGDLPDLNILVLVTGVNPLSRGYDCLHESAGGFEYRELLLVLPDPDGLAVGSGVHEIFRGGKASRWVLHVLAIL